MTDHEITARMNELEAMCAGDDRHDLTEQLRQWIYSAEATLAKLREIVPDIYDLRRFCDNCCKMVYSGNPDADGTTEFCIHCNDEVRDLNSGDDPLVDAIQAVLYPKENSNG